MAGMVTPLLDHMPSISLPHLTSPDLLCTSQYAQRRSESLQKHDCECEETKPQQHLWNALYSL